MPYYIRVLSTSTEPPTFAELNRALKEAGTSAQLTVEEGNGEAWDAIAVADSEGSEVAVIERNLVKPDSLGEEELEEFVEEIGEALPVTARAWLLDFFERVRCIYAIQVLGPVDQGNGWLIVGTLHERLRIDAPAILQADGEGFTNDAGFHILWQFNDGVEGPWDMGVLENGSWTYFEMDLGSRKHREAFLDGRVPHGVKRIEP